MPGGKHIFVSYSRADAKFARKLAQDLRFAGVDNWIDQLDIPPGARWDRAVEDALRASERVLIILSPSSVSSENVQDEIGFALSEQRPIVPVLYRQCNIPLRIQRLQYVDFTQDYGEGLARLLGTLKGGAWAPKPKKDKEYCIHCGTLVDPKNRFCTNCGRQI